MHINRLPCYEIGESATTFDGSISFPFCTGAGNNIRHVTIKLKNEAICQSFVYDEFVAFS